MTWEYTRAENGNVALTAGIDLSKSQGDLSWRLVLAKTRMKRPGMPSPACATVLTRQSSDYISGWQEWMKTHASLKQGEVAPGDLARKSLAVLRTHESKTGAWRSHCQPRHSVGIQQG